MSSTKNEWEYAPGNYYTDIPYTNTADIMVDWSYTPSNDTQTIYVDTGTAVGRIPILPSQLDKETLQILKERFEKAYGSVQPLPLDSPKEEPPVVRPRKGKRAIIMRRKKQ